MASEMSVTEVVIIPGFKLPTSFEFFNYAGIHWSVIPLSTSNGAFISDISTSTNVSSDLERPLFLPWWIGMVHLPLLGWLEPVQPLSG